MAEEIAHRQQTRLGRLSRRARFPFLKTIDDFNFTYQSTVRLSLLGTALSADFVTGGGCLILHGKPGLGTTHLAVAIAYRAFQNGFDALFVTAAEMIDDLSAAFRAGRLAAALAAYTHPAILVVDEVGYLRLSRHQLRWPELPESTAGAGAGAPEPAPAPEPERPLISLRHPAHDGGRAPPPKDAAADLA